VTAFEVTQLERAWWQRQAAAELAAILDAHADVPVIAWTVSAFGGSLSGRVTAPASQARGLFTAWQQALRLDDIAETPAGNGMAGYLRARAWRDGVLVTVIATAPGREGEDR